MTRKPKRPPKPNAPINTVAGIVAHLEGGGSCVLMGAGEPYADAARSISARRRSFNKSGDHER